MMMKQLKADVKGLYMHTDLGYTAHMMLPFAWTPLSDAVHAPCAIRSPKTPTLCDTESSFLALSL
jgi:hypothetical protein